MTRKHAHIDSSRSILGPPPLPAAGERWALFIDIDGTLADFALEPKLVRIDAATREFLVRLTASLDGALAVLSGRALTDVDRVLSPLVLPAGAMHGLESRDANGVVTFCNPPGDIATQVGRACEERVKALDGVWVEHKGGVAFALHFRTVRAQESAVQRLAQELAEASAGQYVVQLGDCVAELRPAGADKGMALAAMLERPPFRHRRPIVLGDDFTDEVAFAVAARLEGFGVIVGSRRPTRARHGLPSPEAVRQWLGQLAEHMERVGRSA
jgi:trehalose 6-phosphate phosphatase